MGFYALISAGPHPKKKTRQCLFQLIKTKAINAIRCYLTVGEVKYGNGNAKSIDNIVAEFLNFQINATLRKSANA